MTKKQKIKRGQQIFDDLGKVINKGKFSEQYYYACDIYHAVSEETHDVPIKKEDMLIALAEAEEQNKKVYVVEDDEFKEQIDSLTLRQRQLDGWSFHLEIR